MHSFVNEFGWAFFDQPWNQPLGRQFSFIILALKGEKGLSKEKQNQSKVLLISWENKAADHQKLSIGLLQKSHFSSTRSIDLTLIPHMGCAHYFVGENKQMLRIIFKTFRIICSSSREFNRLNSKKWTRATIDRLRGEFQLLNFSHWVSRWVNVDEMSGGQMSASRLVSVGQVSMRAMYLCLERYPAPIDDIILTWSQHGMDNFCAINGIAILSQPVCQLVEKLSAAKDCQQP